MAEVFHFLETYETWIYIILGAGVLFYIRPLVMAYREWHASSFSMEREKAQRRFSFSLTLVGLLFFIGVIVFSLTSFVAPVFPHEQVLLTPTLDILATPTATLAAVNGTPAADTTPVVQVTSTPRSDGCVTGQVEWTFPKSGEEIGGSVELKGTVKVTNLGFYKYEYSQPGVENWITIAAGNEAKEDQPLGGVWNTAQLIPGDYLLRLLVTDNNNQAFPACVISIRVVAQ